MKNIVICKNCNSKNPFHELICRSCKSYLRERVYNIDLWKTIGLLIESPSQAFKLIIFSEHKNFLILAFILISGKMLLNGIFMTIYFSKQDAFVSSYFTDYILTLILTSIIFIVFAGMLLALTKKSGTETRFKDNLSIITYSFIPFAFGLILFPIELILFGGYLFYYNPSPFHLKETLAYALFAFEILLFLWSIFLTFKAAKMQTNSATFSFVFTLFIQFTYNFLLYFMAKELYK